MAAKFASVDDYVAAQPPDVQRILGEIRHRREETITRCGIQRRTHAIGLHVNDASADHRFDKVLQALRIPCRIAPEHHELAGQIAWRHAP